MGAFVLMNDLATQRVAYFEEPTTSGAVDDPNSARNAPINDPVSWLDYVKFHSDFDYYQVAMGPTPVTVAHLAIAGATVTVYNLAGATFARQGQMVENEYDLVTHGLGYEPRYMVISNGHIVAPGTLIQVATAQDRVVTPYATTTKIRLHEIGTSSASTLAGVSVDYEVLVFKQPAFDSPYERDFDETTGRLILGYGKFDSALKMLRKAGASASPFDISLGPTIDIGNGGAKTVLADGTTVTDTNYSGSFSGSASIQCAVE